MKHNHSSDDRSLSKGHIFSPSRHSDTSSSGRLKEAHSSHAKEGSRSNSTKKGETSYEKAVRTSKPGEGKRFKALSKGISSEYEKKGKSPEEAKRIAGAIAAKIGRAKYGGKKMANWSARGRKS